MALPPPKTPPRFVPTLTEVVQLPDAGRAPLPATAPARTTVMSPAATVGARPAAPLLPSGQMGVRPPNPSPLSAARPAVTSTFSAASPRVAPAVAPPPARPMAPVAAPAPAGAAGRTTLTRPLPNGMEEYMVHRVMQRVDVVLDQRLREAIATVVQEQTRSVLPRLREEIESVVRHAVYEAVADELASGAPTATKG